MPAPAAPSHTFICPDQSVAVTLGSDFSLAGVFGGQGYARRLYVGTGGTVVATKLNDAGPMTYKNVPNGAYLDGLWITVVKTGTTAADIVAEK